jgi:hypothetical protein
MLIFAQADPLGSLQNMDQPAGIMLATWLASPEGINLLTDAHGGKLTIASPPPALERAARAITGLAAPGAGAIVAVSSSHILPPGLNDDADAQMSSGRCR